MAPDRFRDQMRGCVSSSSLPDPAGPACERCRRQYPHGRVKGIPENLARVGGRPLVARAVGACRRADLVDRWWSPPTMTASPQSPATPGPPWWNALPTWARTTASSESALLHALDRLRKTDVPQILVFVQCTSPFIDPADLDDAVRQVRDDLADSVFSAMETYEFLSESPPTGHAGSTMTTPTGRAARTAPRLPGDRRVLRDARRRFRGTGTGSSAGSPCSMVHPPHAVEMDTPEDLDLAARSRRALDRDEPSDVDAVVTDFDGVHTDDRVYVDQDGRETVRGEPRRRYGGEPAPQGRVSAAASSPPRQLGGARRGREARRPCDARAERQAHSPAPVDGRRRAGPEPASPTSATTSTTSVAWPRSDGRSRSRTPIRMSSPRPGWF